MFRHVSPIRLFLCRASFVLLCLAPTLCACAWGIAWWLPGHRREYEQAISHELGLEVRLAAVSHPRPGLTVLSGLQATELETQRVVAQVQEIKLASNGVGLVVVAGGAEIDAAALADVWQALERTLVRRPSGSSRPVRVVANELTLRWPERTEKLVSLAGRIETLDDGPQARFEWRWPASTATKPPQFTIFRDRHGGPPQTGFELDTGDEALDLSLLSPAIPVGEWLGPRAQFSGYVWARRGERGWRGTARNSELSQIDLSSLISDHVGHEIRGLARLQVDDAEFVDGRLRQASGALDAGPGFVSQALLQATAAALSMNTNAQDAQYASAILPYERLAFQLKLDAGGIFLTGQGLDNLPGAVMVDRDKSLLDEPAAQPQPVSSVARLFAGPDDQAVPQSPRARALLEMLPAPPVRDPHRTADRFKRADNFDPPRQLDGAGD